jgi:hypothetical protein
VSFALTIYAIGVVIGLIGTDARPLARVCLALAWPVGALAFVVTVSGLLAASTVLFPVFGLAVLAAAILAWLVT